TGPRTIIPDGGKYKKITELALWLPVPDLVQPAGREYLFGDPSRGGEQISQRVSNSDRVEIEHAIFEGHTGPVRPAVRMAEISRGFQHGRMETRSGNEWRESESATAARRGCDDPGARTIQVPQVMDLRDRERQRGEIGDGTSERGPGSVCDQPIRTAVPFAQDLTDDMEGS